mgnify:CR=1 FL=1
MSQSANAQRVPISVGSLLWIALIVWLVMPSPGPAKRQLDALREEVTALRQEVGLLRQTLEAPGRAAGLADEGQGKGAAATQQDSRAGAAPTPADSAQTGSVADESENIPIERE